MHEQIAEVQNSKWSKARIILQYVQTGKVIFIVKMGITTCYVRKISINWDILGEDTHMVTYKLLGKVNHPF